MQSIVTTFGQSRTAVYEREIAAAPAAAFRRHIAHYALAVATLALAFGVGLRTGNLPDFDVLRDYGFYLLVAFWIGGSGGALALLVKLALFDRNPSPLGAFFAAFHDFFRDRARIANGLNGLAAMMIFMTGFSVLKGSIAILRPFTWDRTLADVDRWLHFGRLPHDWLWPVLNSAVAVHAINFAYNFWFFILVALVFVATIARRDTLLRHQFLLSFMLVWLAGGFFVALGFSSAGPCYFLRLGLGGEYRELMEALALVDGTHSVWALSTQDVLWDGYTGATPGSIGISAFPSLHVATAVLFALYAMRRSAMAGILLWVFAGVILLGSVVLGWHYAVDGYAGILLAILIWKDVEFGLLRWFPGSLRAT